MPEYRADPDLPEDRAVAVKPLDMAYFLDILGDSHNSLGRHSAAIEAYRQAALAFRQQDVQTAYAMCLFKIAESHRSLGQADQAVSYLEACLPLLGELGLGSMEKLARSELTACLVGLQRTRPVSAPLAP